MLYLRIRFYLTTFHVRQYLRIRLSLNSLCTGTDHASFRWTTGDKESDIQRYSNSGHEAGNKSWSSSNYWINSLYVRFFFSRYIHLNPVDAYITPCAEDFHWSSYRFFITSCSTPSYLYLDKTLNYFQTKNSKQHYKKFVEQGVDQDTYEFYSKKVLRSIFGSNSFIQSLMDCKIINKEIPEIKRHQMIKKTIEEVASITTSHFKIDSSQLIGPLVKGNPNNARPFTIYLARYHCGIDLITVAEFFKLKHYASVSRIAINFKQKIQGDRDLKNTLKQLLLLLATDKPCD